MKRTKKCIRQGQLRPEALERAAQALKMLAHPQRLKIIEILEHEESEPVHALIEETALPQPVVSQHLNQMRRMGLLSAERRGKEMWYSIADDRALSILDCICNHCTKGDFE
jgi:DNA-binding transcriptional ArsR family regulator